jgi:hypothetical protein
VESQSAWYNDGMDENPYQSPQSEPEAGPPCRKASKQYGQALVSGFFAFIGTFNIQMTVLGLMLPPYKVTFPPYTVILFLLIPGASTVAMATWGWHRPESKWVRAATVLIAVCGFAPLIVGLFLDGLH